MCATSILHTISCADSTLVFLFFVLHYLFFFCFFFLMIRRPPRSTLFPYRRSSDLSEFFGDICGSGILQATNFAVSIRWIADRKSTRLNSSHTVISYAVFCLKKKKKPDNT